MFDKYKKYLLYLINIILALQRHSKYISWEVSSINIAYCYPLKNMLN